jgi:hypothetical protein
MIQFKSIRISILTSILLLLVENSQCQNISGILYNKEKDHPVQDAYVFIDDSSIGTISDESGYFNLELKELDNLSLIVSHISYENKTVHIEQNMSYLDTIFLIENSFELGEVVLNTESNKRLRKKRMKRFKNAFLGSEENRKNVEIINPEAILFYEENKTLYAIAEEPIIIQNDHLGYTMNFFLKEFQLHKNEDVFYKGNTSFKEIEGNKKKLAKIKRNRRKVYAETHRSFFYNLINGNIDKETYLIGSSQKNYIGDFVQFIPIELDSLNIVQNMDGKYELTIENHFTVKPANTSENKDAADSRKGGGRLYSGSIKEVKNNKEDKSISYLASKSNKIILDKNGRILNSSEVEEHGYWATKRIAYMLPLDYTIIKTK